MTAWWSRPQLWKGAGWVAVLIVGLSVAKWCGASLGVGEFWLVLGLPVLVLFYQRTPTWGAWSSVVPLGVVAALVVLTRMG